MLKFQFVSGMAQGGSSPGGMAGQGNNVDKIIGMACQAVFMLLIGFADELAKQIPALINHVRSRIISKISSSNLTQSFDNLRQTPIEEYAVLLDKRHFTNSVMMSRIYPDNEKDQLLLGRMERMNGMIDAILKVVTKQHNVPSFRLIETAQLMLNYKDNPIQLTNEIYIKVDKVEAGASGFISRIDISLMSNTVSASDISKYIRHVYDLHLQDLKNALGDTTYYFDQKSKDGNMRCDPRTASMQPEDIVMHKQMKIQSAPKSLSFTKSPFVSNKNFENIFGDGVRNIEKRINFFLKNKAWYDSRGIPYQLGLMMSGAPGTGKTSIIRAIANMTKRHIINVNFGNIASATQLKNLFQAEKLSVYSDSTCSDVTTFHIPIDQRIYVLEEIDTVGDVVRQRGSMTNETGHTAHDEVTLGEILTVLDGTMETPGRLVIMTSNHPELLDEALIRPGRIDVMVKFGKASRNAISEMFRAFYDAEMSPDQVKAVPHEQLTPAEVGQVLFKHFDDDSSERIVSVIRDLQDTTAEINKVRESRERAQREEMEQRKRQQKKKSQKSKSSKKSKKPVEADPIRAEQPIVKCGKIKRVSSSSSSESISEYSSSEEETNPRQSGSVSKDMMTSPPVLTGTPYPSMRSVSRELIFPKDFTKGSDATTSMPAPQPFNDGFSSLDDAFAPLSDGIKAR